MVDPRRSMACPVPRIHLPTVKIARPRVPMAAPGAAARPLPPPRAWVGGARRRPPRARVGFNGVRRDGEARGEEPGRRWLRRRGNGGDCRRKETTRPMVLGQNLGRSMLSSSQALLQTYLGPFCCYADAPLEPPGRAGPREAR